MGLTRREFAARVGLLKEIDPLTDQAYDFAQWLASQTSDQGVAHADPWHLSFHGSQFPGDSRTACSRAAMYRLMDVPRPLMPRWLEQVADAGKDIEDRLVQKWYDAGYLISAPPTDPFQTSYEDPEYWLTSTVDALVLHPRSNRACPVDVKSKSAADIEAMLLLQRGPDPKHVNQIKCQIGLAHEFGPKTVRRCYNSGRVPVKRELNTVVQTGNGHKWGGASIGKTVAELCPEHGTDKCLREERLEPVQYGFLYYVSRDDPSQTWEFFFEYDETFMAMGRKQLAMWRDWFIQGRLPQVNFEDKRFAHPFNWQWTKDEFPCKWCDYGDVCREDTKRAIKIGEPISLAASAGVEAAMEVREEYDFDLVRMAVLKRWGLESDT
jgi:hypothetical protein